MAPTNLLCSSFGARQGPICLTNCNEMGFSLHTNQLHSRDLDGLSLLFRKKYYSVTLLAACWPKRGQLEACTCVAHLVRMLRATTINLEKFRRIPLYLYLGLLCRSFKHTLSEKWKDPDTYSTRPCRPVGDSSSFDLQLP